MEISRPCLQHARELHRRANRPYTQKFLVMQLEVGQTLRFVISQDKWPLVRSEGWFIFALISSFPEGARCVGDLIHDMTIFQRLVELVSKESPSAYTQVSSTGSPSSILPPETVVSGRVVSKPGAECSSRWCGWSLI